MNILFEIADRDLMIIGAIFLAILLIAFIVFKVVTKANKVKPISEDERFDNEENIEDRIKVTEVTQEETEEQKKAKEELERVYMQMSADLEKQESEPIEVKEDHIDEFERKQEENAIISYQELMAKAEQLKKEANKYETHTESAADMKVKEAMNTYQKHTSKKVSEKEAYHGFKNSDIISPIYGIQKEKKDLSKTQSNDIISKAYEEMNTKSENEKNIDFLNSLKEFRKNL